jgi:hypothetical protein
MLGPRSEVCPILNPAGGGRTPDEEPLGRGPHGGEAAASADRDFGRCYPNRLMLNRPGARGHAPIASKVRLTLTDDACDSRRAKISDVSAIPHRYGILRREMARIGVEAAMPGLAADRS